MARRRVPAGPVTVVTDSSASLPEGEARRAGVTVVPLHVVIDGMQGREGYDVGPDDVARALKSRRHTVTTSRPSPDELAAAYDQAFERGARSITSVHLSGELSGTVAAAERAASMFDDAVVVLDSRSVGMGLGYSVLAAAREARAGWDADRVAEVARDAARKTTVLFSVDTLEYLRRGGRIGAARALLGAALAVKPILHLSDGAIAVREKVRTTAAATRRLEDLAVEASRDRDRGAGCGVAVHHVGAPDRAEALRARLAERVEHPFEMVVSELSAAVGAHLGPGALGVVVGPHPRRRG